MKQTCILFYWLGSLLRQSLLFLKQPHIDRSIDIIYMHMYIYVYTYIRIYIYIYIAIGAIGRSPADPDD